MVKRLPNGYSYRFYRQRGGRYSLVIQRGNRRLARMNHLTRTKLAILIGEYIIRR